MFRTYGNFQPPTALKEVLEYHQKQRYPQVIDSKSGRRGSNPRRPAWENGRKLIIKNYCVYCEHRELRKTRKTPKTALNGSNGVWECARWMLFVILRETEQKS